MHAAAAGNFVGRNYALETVFWSYHCIFPAKKCSNKQRPPGHAKQPAGARLKGQSTVDRICESNPINVVGTSHNGPRVREEGAH